MCPQPSDGHAQRGLSGSLIRLVQDDHQIDQLREELSSFSHRYRNLLNGMKMSLYLMRRGGAGTLPSWWGEVEENYGGIERLLDHLQAIYRPMPLTLVRAPFRSLIQDHQRIWCDWFSSSGRSLEIEAPATESMADFDPMRLTMGLDAFVRWRVAAIPPGQRACLSWRTDGQSLEVRWRESGGLGPPFDETGGRACRGDRVGPGTPELLALPLLTRVISAHRGTLEWTRVPEFQVDLGWPLEQARAADEGAEGLAHSPLTAAHATA